MSEENRIKTIHSIEDNLDQLEIFGNAVVHLLHGQQQSIIDFTAYFSYPDLQKTAIQIAETAVPETYIAEFEDADEPITKEELAAVTEDAKDAWPIYLGMAICENNGIEVQHTEDLDNLPEFIFPDSLNIDDLNNIEAITKNVKTYFIQEITAQTDMAQGISDDMLFDCITEANTYLNSPRADHSLSFKECIERMIKENTTQLHNTNTNEPCLPMKYGHVLH